MDCDNLSFLILSWLKIFIFYNFFRNLRKYTGMPRANGNTQACHKQYSVFFGNIRSLLLSLINWLKPYTMKLLYINVDIYYFCLIFHLIMNLIPDIEEIKNYTEKIIWFLSNLPSNHEYNTWYGGNYTEGKLELVKGLIYVLICDHPNSSSRIVFWS